MSAEMSPELEAMYREAQERITTARAAAPDIEPTAPRAPLRVVPAPEQADPATLRARGEAMLRGLGIVPVDDATIAAREASLRAEDDAAHAIEARAAVTAMPVPRDLVDAIVADAVASTRALDSVRRWHSTRGKPTLLLLGGVGTGKTIAGAWLIARTAGVYRKMRDVANLYRAGFGEEHAEFNRLLWARALVIDELTSEPDATLGKAALHCVVDERATRGLPTLLLANRTKETFAQSYDARTLDRLRECAAVVALAGASMRLGSW